MENKQAWIDDYKAGKFDVASCIDFSTQKEVDAQYKILRALYGVHNVLETEDDQLLCLWYSSENEVHALAFPTEELGGYYTVNTLI